MGERPRERAQVFTANAKTRQGHTPSNAILILIPSRQLATTITPSRNGFKRRYIKRAIADVDSKRFESTKAVAAAYNINRSTLSRYLREITRARVHIGPGAAAAFANAERLVVGCIKRQEERGHPVSLAQLRGMVLMLLKFSGLPNRVGTH